MRIWPWSRIADLERANFNLNRRLEQWETSLGTNITTINAKLNRLNTTVGAITPGLGRIIAKLDSQFARNPLSPDMKAESDVITEREIDRIKREDAAAKEALRVLEAEQAVRDQYHYTPESDQ